MKSTVYYRTKGRTTNLRTAYLEKILYMTEMPIANLLDSLDLNKRFKTSAYFTICFNSLPSSLHLVLSSEKKQDAVDAILTEMELEKFNFETVFKNWSTEDFQNSQPNDDYVFEYVFKSEAGRMLIHFTARDFSYITVEFLYDHTLKESEDWGFVNESQIAFKVWRAQKAAIQSAYAPRWHVWHGRG